MTEPKKKSFVRRLLAGIWRAVDASRRAAVNLVFLLLVVLLLSLLLSAGGPEVPDTAVLVVAPRGNVVEQLEGDSLSRAIAEMMGDGEPQTLFWDLLDAIEAATEDDRIQVLRLDLDGLGGVGLSKLQDLGEAVDAFRAAGKKVIASADNYSQAAYYLASRADEIYLHEMGAVLLTGYGRYRTYYKDGLDRLEVDVNVFRVGTFKSAVEPFLRDDMSEAAREANLEFLDDLWQAWLTDVAAAREVPRETLVEYAESFPELLRRQDGDLARMALEAGLVDHVTGREAVRDRLVELVGENEETHSYHHIGHDDYLETLGDGLPRLREGDDRVAVLVARGSIIDGSQPPGSIGGDSTAALARRARHDENVKALVLRVDSGGGSAFASEVIRRELALLREAGKPVVVSMGSVAASGGYWISTSSDEIWASPTTLTGSIGIFGLFPTFQKPLAKHLGVRVDGVGTAPLAGALRPDRELAPEAAEAIQMMIERGYREFLERVADAREMTTEEVDGIAQGRIWSGQDAYELKLVDGLGGLSEAVAAAARLAELPEDGYGVTWLEQEEDFTDRLLADLVSRAAAWTGRGSAAPPPPHLAVLHALAEEAQALAELNDPRGLYALCLCEAE